MGERQAQAARRLEERTARVRYTRDGYAFDPNADRWCLPDISRPVSFDFNTLPASRTMIASIKAVMTWYAEHGAVATMGPFLALLRDFLRHESEWVKGPVEEIDTGSIWRYRFFLDRRDERAFGNITGLIKKWHAPGLPGVTDRAAQFLHRTSFTKPRASEAVLTMDPVKGPFTDLELTGLVAALKNAYAHREISREEYVLAALFPLLARISHQVASEGVEMVRLPLAAQAWDVFARRTRVRARRRTCQYRASLRSKRQFQRAPWPRSTRRKQSDPRPQP